MARTARKSRKTSKASKTDVYQEVTDRIVEALDKKIIPWRRPWATIAGGGGQLSLSTRRPYRGVNQLLLQLTAEAAGYTSPYWLTFKQAKALGGQVRKGERSTMVVFWRRWEVKDGESTDPDAKKQVLVLRYYNVFNVEQCDDIDPAKVPAVPEPPAFEPIDEAERVIAEMPNRKPEATNGDEGEVAAA